MFSCSPTSSPARASDRADQGFTLIELMIVLAIAGILAAVALPSYLEQVRKGRRSDAVSALSSVQQAQERWRANRSTYADELSALGFASSYSPKGYYELTLSNVGPGGYTVTAQAVSGRAQDGDSRCARMWVTLSRGNLNYQSTSPECWAQ